MGLSVFLAARSPAEATGFDCARANLSVDFVVCRSDEGRKAITDLTDAWTKLLLTLTPDRKAALVSQQRQWIKTYPQLCGLGERGRPAPDVTKRTDACVIDHVVRRTAVLKAVGFAYSKDREAPSAFVDELIAPYQNGDNTVTTDANVELYLTPRLAKAFRDGHAAPRQSDEPSDLDGDLFTRLQEAIKISDVQSNVVSLDPTHARGVVTYKTADTAPATALTLDLLRTEQGWRIADLLYTAQNGMPDGTLEQLIAGLPPSTAAPRCAYQPTLTVDTGSPMQAGSWLPIRWNRCAGPSRLETPTFLIITVPDEVRLRGIGFYSLRPQARAPFGFAGAKAIRTGSRPHSRELISTIRDPSWTGSASPAPFRASWVRSDARALSRSVMFNFSGSTRTGRSRSRWQGRSRCRSRRRTITSATRRH